MHSLRSPQHFGATAVPFQTCSVCRHLEHHQQRVSVQSRSHISRSRRQRCHSSSKPLISYYEVLEVAEDADKEQLRTAYRLKAKLLHPDVNPKPDAARQFLLVKRAYDTLTNALLRDEHDSKLGLVSARSKDPRFARFERWRREVLPDLNATLDSWTAEVMGVVQDAHSTLSQLQSTAAATVAAAAAAAAQPASDAAAVTGQKGGTTAPGLGARPAATSTRSTHHGSTTTTAAADSAPPMLLDLYSEMDRVLRDAQGNVDRLYTKRYEQLVAGMAYPDIVWFDVWEEVSEGWLLEVRQLTTTWEARIAAGLNSSSSKGTSH